MRNYSSRFKLPNDKWAYIQLDDLADRAKQHVGRIRQIWKPPGHFYHLREGGHVAALRQHQVNPWYGKIDLSSFFNNVTRHRITRCLKRIGYSFREAENFAVASTVCVNLDPRRFALPYGFVQSPLLASLVLDSSELGNCFRRLSSGVVTMSVYVDDIILSASTEVEVAAALSEVRHAARRSHFPINTAKSVEPAPALRAFNIDFDTHDMKITGERFEEMCQEVLVRGAGQVSDGIRSYVQSVSPEQAEQLLKDFPRSFPDG